MKRRDVDALRVARHAGRYVWRGEGTPSVISTCLAGPNSSRSCTVQCVAEAGRILRTRASCSESCRCRINESRTYSVPTMYSMNNRSTTQARNHAVIGFSIRWNHMPYHRHILHGRLSESLTLMTRDVSRLHTKSQTAQAHASEQAPSSAFSMMLFMLSVHPCCPFLFVCVRHRAHTKTPQRFKKHKQHDETSVPRAVINNASCLMPR
jgi:hypothetical protein